MAKQSDKENSDGNIGGPKLQLEREGRRQIEQIVQQVKAVPIGVKLLQLAWTAGPVTFIALQSGYYLAFGEFAPLKNIFYFATYTVIAGVFSLIITGVYDTISANNKQRAQRNLSAILDKLPDLIIATRNLYIGSLNQEERRFEVASHILHNSHASAPSVRAAVRELTDDVDLSTASEYIEILRRAGMHARIRDIYQYHYEKINEVVEKLRNISGELPYIFQNRMQGLAPTLQAGLPRTDGFIERVLSSGEEGNEALMSARDVVDMFTLVFEVLCGREFTMLELRYKGRRSLTDAATELERSRSDYRIAYAVFNSRLQALINLLAGMENVQLSLEQQEQEDEDHLQTIYQGITTLCQHIERQRVALSNDMTVQKHKFQQQIEALDKALNLYRSLYQAKRTLRRKQSAMIRAWRRWEEVSKHYRDKDQYIQTGRNRLGFAIMERKIALEPDKKLELAKDLIDTLEGISIRRVGQRLIIRSQEQDKPLTMQAAKQLAVQTALTLNQYINISTPMAQDAIESTNAANLGSLELGLSADTKAGWGVAMIKEVEDNLGKTAEKLAHVLVTDYGVSLDEDTRQFLKKAYGANPRTLEQLKPMTKRAKFRELIVDKRLPQVPVPDKYWSQTLERAQSHLKRMA